MPGIKIKTHTSTLIQTREFTIQPISQSIHWLGKWGGVIWNRPYAVRVNDGQSIRQLPIRDKTRIWGLTAVFGLIFFSSKPKKEQRNE